MSQWSEEIGGGIYLYVKAPRVWTTSMKAYDLLNVKFIK